MNIPEAEALLGGKYTIVEDMEKSLLGDFKVFVATRVSGYTWKGTIIDELVAVLNGKGHSKECHEHTEQMLEAQDEYARKWPNYCRTCSGVGGFHSTYDPSPAGVSLAPGTMDDFDPCTQCVDEGICPRCGKKVWNVDEDEIGVCSNCGWDAMNPDAMPQGYDDMCPCQQAEMDKALDEAAEWMRE
jgi:hypothetical protein